MLVVQSLTRSGINEIIVVGFDQFMIGGGLYMMVYAFFDFNSRGHKCDSILRNNGSLPRYTLEKMSILSMREYGHS